MQAPEPSNVNLGRPEPLILVGASVRAAAQSAARAGFQVTGIDLFGDVDTRAACQNFVPLGKSTLSDVTRLHPDAATPLLVVGGIDGGDPSVRELQRRYRLLGPGEEQRERISLPEFLQAIARAAGTRFPDFHRQVEHGRASPGRWLMKNPNSCGGLAIRWAQACPQEDQACPQQDQACPQQDQACPQQDLGDRYAQRWQAGRSYGAVFLSDSSSARLLGICSGRFTRLGDRPFVYAGSCGPVALPGTLTDTIKRIGDQVVRHSSLAGIFNVDVIIDGNELWLLEVNPRWSASCELIERAMIDSACLSPQQSLIALAVRQRGGDRPSIGPYAPRSCYLKRVVFSRRTGQFDFRRIDGLSDLNAVFADVPSQGSLIRVGEPILSVMLTYRSRGTIRWQTLRRLLASVQNSVA